MSKIIINVSFLCITLFIVLLPKNHCSAIIAVSYSFICVLFCIIQEKIIKHVKSIRFVQKIIVLISGCLCVTNYLGNSTILCDSYITEISIVLTVIGTILLWLITKKSTDIDRKFNVIIFALFSFFISIFGLELINVEFDTSNPIQYICEIDMYRGPYIYELLSDNYPIKIILNEKSVGISKTDIEVYAKKDDYNNMIENDIQFVEISVKQGYLKTSYVFDWTPIKVNHNQTNQGTAE